MGAARPSLRASATPNFVLTSGLPDEREAPERAGELTPVAAIWTPSLVGGLLIRQQSESVWVGRCRTAAATVAATGTDRGRRSLPELWMCFQPLSWQLGSEQP